MSADVETQYTVAEVSSLKSVLTINDIVRLTRRSRRTIIRWFESEPGTILLLDNPEEMHKRRYRTLRVPRAVYERVTQQKRFAHVNCATHATYT